MLLSDLLRGIAVGLIAVLLFTNALEVWHVCALSLLFGLVDACFPSAYRAALPDSLPQEDLTSANSLTDLSAQLSGIAGPVIAALIVAAGGSSLAFGLDALSFFISRACLLPLTRLALRVSVIGLSQRVWLIFSASFVIGVCNSMLGMLHPAVRKLH